MKNLIARSCRATAVAGLICLMSACGESNNPAPPPANSDTLTVGGLLSLTGTWSSLGLNSQATMQIAADDVNAYFERVGVTRRVSIDVVDTRLDPAQAQQALRGLASRGVHVVVGPQSSAEVAALKPFADANSVLLVSQGSTAHTLAIADDHVFRLCPDDVEEGAAIVALMLSDGKQVIVPMTRDDAGNQGLQVATKAGIEAAGGTVLPLTAYAATTTDFTTLVHDLATQVGQAVSQSGSDAVAVYLTAFDEAQMIFHEAMQYPALAAVRWYGSDGVAASAVLAGDPVTAAFASAVAFPCPIFGLDPATADRWEPLAGRIAARTGIAPDAFALSTYDAVWLLALASLQAPASDLSRYVPAFVQTASTYLGVTGPTTLNAAGDRRAGPFDFLGLCPSAGGYDWQRVGGFEPAAGTSAVTYDGCAVP